MNRKTPTTVDWSAALLAPLSAEEVSAINQSGKVRTSDIKVPHNATPHSNDYFDPPAEAADGPQE